MTDYIVLDGCPPSSDVRLSLAREDREVLLAFSGGKDALAAWFSLRDACVRVVPYYLYYVPGLRFVEDAMTRWEDFFGVEIHRYPHPSLFRWLNNLVFQAPENCAIIESALLPTPSHSLTLSVIREDLGLPADTWVADGVRAADSIVRRTSFATHGVQKEHDRKVSVVWDWRKRHVMERIAAGGATLPVDYEWFGRSFDGIDYRFLEPISRHALDDYERILSWFPLAELELFRRQMREGVTDGTGNEQ